MGDLKKGVSQSTGNEWQSRYIMLEWMDGEGTHRVWATLFNEQAEHFVQQQIDVNDAVNVRLRFSTRSFRTGFVSTEVLIEEIQKVNV